MSLGSEPFSAARNRMVMPVMQNETISRKEKSMPPSTAKPLSMDAAAAHSRKKYQVLWVNLSFIGGVLQQKFGLFQIL